jgi:predicted nucleotidyltransferase
MVMAGPSSKASGAVMTTLRVIQEKRQRLLAVAARHGARNLRVFGSMARGEADAASDLDLLVDLEPGRSLIDLGALLVELEALLGMRVDVVTEAGLRPAIRARILRTTVPL